MPINNLTEWTSWTDKVIQSRHGDIETYRKLYDGDHSALFERAKDLIENGEITDQLYKGKNLAGQISTPYLIANVCKVIVDVPAMLVSRAIGRVNTSVGPDDFDNPDETLITASGKEVDRVEYQRDILDRISKRSKLSIEHKTNIVHHQMDGGIVGVPMEGENGVYIDFKSRDVYFPHDDGQGCDLVYEKDFDEDGDRDDLKYLHVYTERLEDGTLKTLHRLFRVGNAGALEEIEDIAEITKILGITKVNREYKGRDKTFVVYWPNGKTFHNPLGTSTLRNMAGKQDEVNWRLTSNSIVYERNGKPRIAVSKEIFEELKEKAHERYGDESKIDHRDLEIVTFDKNGKAMEIIQIDVEKIGGIPYIKNLIKIMLMETFTSEKAVDFYMEGGSGATSGIAKFYDLFTSILKSEQILDEYVAFQQELFENALWIANLSDPNVVIEEPRFQIKSMLPMSRKELLEQEGVSYSNKSQSLQTTVENQNPNASDEWIQEEMDRIDDENSSPAPSTFASIPGANSLDHLMDNRDTEGNIDTGEEEEDDEQTGDNPEDREGVKR